MNTERTKWLDERRKGIGASEAGSACGVSPWKSPYQLWLEKRGEIPPQKDSESLYWGRALEPVIRQRYADETGRTVKLVNTFKSEKHPFMFASPDGIIEGEPRGLEIKTSRNDDGWGEPGTNEIPEVYLCQIQHQMIVVGLIVVDVPVLIGGSDFRIYEVPADPELQELIIDKETAFWRMVQKGTPPDVVSYADIKQRFGKMSKAVKVQADRAVVEAVERLRELKVFAKEEETLKALIMTHMKDADTLVDDADHALVTWKASRGSKRFDVKEFQAEQPELYEKFLKEGEPSRRFLIK